MSNGSNGGCQACGRQGVWSKLGSCVRCMRIAWWGTVVAWLGVVAAFMAAAPSVLGLAALGVAGLFSVLWLAHWGAFVGKNVASIRQLGNALGQPLGRRDLLRLAVHQAGAALILVWGQGAFGRVRGDDDVIPPGDDDVIPPPGQDEQIDDPPGCGPLRVRVRATARAANAQAACNEARLRLDQRIFWVIRNCHQYCARDNNDPNCRSRECVCLQIADVVRCGPARRDPQQGDFVCTCEGTIHIICHCLQDTCGVLGPILVAGAEACNANQNRALQDALASLQQAAQAECDKRCTARNRHCAVLGQRCVCAGINRLGQPECRHRTEIDGEGNRRHCYQCSATYQLRCRCS